MYSFFWNLSQDSKIRNVSSGVRRRGERTARNLRDLEESVERLSLISRAMWTLMSENTSLTEQDLADKVRDLDLMDGTEDGKLVRDARTCEACGKNNHKRHQRCLYCGDDLPDTSPFDSV